jgi:two-component system NtrC family sensor kinase
MNLRSLRIKFALVAVSIGVVCFGVMTYFSNRFTKNQFEDFYQEKALLIWNHVTHELEESMILLKDHTEVLNILKTYRTYKEVTGLRVFSSQGKEVFAEREGPPEPRIEETLRTAVPVHFHQSLHDTQVATHIVPLINKPECHGCHGDQGKVVGALVLSLSLNEMRHDIAQQNLKYLVLFAFTTLMISMAILLGVNRIFLGPLKHLQKGTETIERGDFKYQIQVVSKDEIGSLTENFNRMTQKLRNLFEELEDKNRKLADQHLLLSRSQEEWQKTFDEITDPIAVIDMDYNFLRANRGFRDYFSLSQEGPIQQKCYELFRTCFQIDCPHIPSCPHLLSVQLKTPITNEHHDARTGKMLILSFFPYGTQGGVFSGSIFIARDITEKKEREMQSIMNERLTALGQMASGIAHEINNPLATIGACTEGLLKRVEKENIGSLLFQSYLKIIDEEVARCKKITTGMLSFVRGTGHEKREIDIHEILDKTVDIVSFQGRLKEVEVHRNHQREIPRVAGNEGELMQAFLSIIVNALDAMEDRGALSVETGTEGGTVFVKISDTGPGIHPDLLKRIFDPFFTTKAEKGGTGLGLSIANRIIKDHNGKIEVTSHEGIGTTVRITFPI